MPLDQADIDRLVEIFKPAAPPHPPIVTPVKTPMDFTNLLATFVAALMGILAVYHQQTTPDPVKPVAPVVVTPVTPTPVDPNADLKAMLEKISARLDALEKGKK